MRNLLLTAGDLRDLARVLEGMAGVIGVREQFQLFDFIVANFGQRRISVPQSGGIVADTQPFAVKKK